jgi:NADPH-dependent F420 reductase
MVGSRRPIGPVALIGGTGRLGPGLALRLAEAGCPVIIGSRDADRAQQRAAEICGRLSADGAAPLQGMENEAAAAAGSLAVLTVPYEAQASLLPGLAGRLAGKVVVSTAVPVRFDAELGPLPLAVSEGSAAEQAAVLLPGSRMVGAFHTVSSAHLARLERRLDEDVLLCGDDDGAKSEVRRLVEMIPGLRCIDAGRLRNARLTEELTVLLLSVNRLARRNAGVRLVGL